jgi:integrase/recombinase XerD
MRTARAFLGWLEEQRALFVSPAHGMILPAPKRPLMPTPTRQDVLRMLKHPNTRTLTGVRDRALLETIYATGARVGELGSMSVQSVDLTHSTIRLMGKGARERVVPLGKQAGKWIQQYLQEVRPQLLQGREEPTQLWIGRKGAPLSYQAFRAIVLTHGKARGIHPPIRPHGLRRACATHMLQNGASPIEIAQLLGHNSFKTLSQYLRLSIREIKDMHQNTPPGK